MKKNHKQITGLVLGLSIFLSHSCLAEEKAKIGVTRDPAEHAENAMAEGNRRGTSTDSSHKKLVVVDEWKPGMEVQAKSVSEHVKVLLDKIEGARKTINSDASLTEEQKNRQLAIFDQFEEFTLKSTEELRKKKIMTSAFNICLGLETDWSRILGDGQVAKIGWVGNLLKNWASPGGVGMGCVTLAFTRNVGSGWPDFLPTIGGSILAGPKAELAEYVNSKRRYARLESFKGVAVMKPLGDSTGIVKVSDLMGTYIGGSVDTVFEGANYQTGLSKTYNVGFFGKADEMQWPPKVGMMVVTKGASDQERIGTPKAQALYFIGGELPYKEFFAKGCSGVTSKIIGDPEGQAGPSQERLKELQTLIEKTATSGK